MFAFYMIFKTFFASEGGVGARDDWTGETAFCRFRVLFPSLAGRAFGGICTLVVP